LYAGDGLAVGSVSLVLDKCRDGTVRILMPQ